MTAATTPGLLVTLVRRGVRQGCLLLPGAGGGLHPYLRMAGFLGESHNVYAVRPMGLLPGELPDDSVPAMTESVLRTLDSAELLPRLVLGWSLGGVVAWEVCVRLAERGQLPDLVIIDSNPLSRPSTEEADQRIRETIVSQLGPRPDERTVERVVRTFDAQVAALVRHRAEQVYPGRVLLLRCAAPDSDVSTDGLRLWGELAPRLRTYTVNAGHFSVLDEAHLPEVTRMVGEFIGRDGETRDGETRDGETRDGGARGGGARDGEVPP